MTPKDRRTLSLILGLLAGVCIAAGSLFLRVLPIRPASANAGSLPQRPVILIDPGHGGMDGGAVGVDGLVEKDLNLQISLILRDLFLANGFEVYMTRETDCSIEDPGLSTIRAKKVSDMKNRRALMESHPDGIFLSIHQNLFSQSKYSGAQMFFSPNHPASAHLAKTLQSTLREMLNPANTRVEKQAGKELYLLYHAQIPAVLVECGFLSNPEEAALLQDSDYQAKVAFAIFCGVLEAYRSPAEAPL